MRWFFPSWSGDFRLEADGDDKCILTVVSPTPGEVAKLGAFLKKARQWPRKWVQQHVGFVPNGESKIPIAAPIAKAGRLFLGERRKGVLTAVISTNGRIKAVLDGDADKVEKETSKKDAKAATSVSRPTLCCPFPQKGPDVRASEVLQTFCTSRQWAEWEKDGLLHCYGNLSGRKYEIAHRHHPLAIKRGKIVWDVEGGYILHCHNWSVPPAEEVLTMKLVLECAEHWIRNSSGAFCTSGPCYNDPFMSESQQGSDGIADAALVRSIGATIGIYTQVYAPETKKPS